MSATVRPRHPRATWIVVTALGTGLSGCTAFERGADQGDPPTDRVTGCPDLSGSYVLQPTTLDGDPDPGVDPGKPVRFEDGALSPAATRLGGSSGPTLYEGVIVRSKGTHALELKFIPRFGQVMEELESIRQHQRPRYTEWYRLLQPARRAAFIAENGEAALQARLRELGPDTGPVVRLNRGPHFTCEDGWVVLPREYHSPVRMTLDDGSNLVFEAKEWTYTGVGGWGDQSLRVPTGAYLGTARWVRDPSVRRWDADDVGTRYVFARPADEIEREQATAAESERRSAERRFADPEVVRDALRPLLPAGVTIGEIEIALLPFIGYRVRVQALPSDPAMDGEEQRRRLEWFLAALKEGDPGFIEDREVVKRAISSGGRVRHEFEIYLDTHPAVQPARESVVVSFTPAPSGLAETASPSTPPPTSAETPVAPTSKPTPSSDPVPPGFALLSDVESRLQPLLATGCRLSRLRYTGEAVILAGEADDMPCVSNTLRAIDGVIAPSGARVELMQIAVDGAGRYRYEIRLPPSPLTRA
jgi:hypothetical protein